MQPYRDPVHDGAADPSVIRDRAGRLTMFYTQRRANLDSAASDGEGTDVAWVHGSAIGVAVSDDGEHWRYDGVLEGLSVPGDDPAGMTFWAPEVVELGGEYRMYLSVIQGVPDRWEGHDRVIREYRSDDLRAWRAVGDLSLSSRRVIDACVAHCPDGRWRLWYKDEADGSTTWAAVSDDAEHWSVEGRVIGGRPHEGPNVFPLGGWWWMLVDEWRGMGVYRSTDAVTWERQGGPDAVILGPADAAESATVHVTDRTAGRHGDVLVEGADARLYYFVHPWWGGSEIEDVDACAARSTVVHDARLRVESGELLCERRSIQASR